MENEIDRVKQIMQPFFDKQEELSRIESQSGEPLDVSSYDDQINNLTVLKNKADLKLKRLKENKQKEIAEYIQGEVLSKSSFYDGYNDMIKNDLEQVYAAEEKKIEDEIQQLEEEKIRIQEQKNDRIEEDKSDRLKRPDYSNVYAREMMELKESIIKSLFEEQTNISLKLREAKILFDVAMLDLSKFKYEYDEQHRPLNAGVYKELYAKSDKAASKINELKKALDLIGEYLNLTKITEHVTPMTPIEQEEYDRRNNSVGNPTSEQLVPKLEEDEVPDLDEIGELPQDFEEDEVPDLDEIGELPQDFEEDEVPDLDEIGELPQDFEENEVPNLDEIGELPQDFEEDEVEDNDLDSGYYEEYESYNDLVVSIYDDILNRIENLHSVEMNSKEELPLNQRSFAIENVETNDYHDAGRVFLGENEIQLPNGVYINAEEFSQAVDNYYKEEKGNSFVVKGIDSVITVAKDTTNKIKRALKKCSALKLVKDNKLSNLDIKQIFGKEKDDNKYSHIGGTFKDANIPDGDYINRNDLLYAVRDSINANKQNWFKRFISKKKYEKIETEGIKDTQEDMDNISNDKPYIKS